MLTNLPSYIAIIFGITALIVGGILFVAIKKAGAENTKKKAILILFGMLIWAYPAGINCCKRVL